jgi:hypothetical protein
MQLPSERWAWSGAEGEIGCGVVGEKRCADECGEEQGIRDGPDGRTIELDDETPLNEATEEDSIRTEQACEHERERGSEPVTRRAVEHAWDG